MKLWLRRIRKVAAWGVIIALLSLVFAGVIVKCCV
jgi:hypothetical protein